MLCYKKKNEDMYISKGGYKKHKALSKNRGRNILGHKSITPSV